MSIQQGQGPSTLDTVCEGHTHTAQGPAPLLETSVSDSPVEFRIESTAIEPTEIDTIHDSAPSSLGLFRLGMTGSQDGHQLPNNTAITRPASLTDAARDDNITTVQCIEPAVEIQSRTAFATPARSPLPRIVGTPVLARTMQTIESECIETPQQCPGTRPLVHIAGSSVRPAIETVVPSTVSTIPDKPSSTNAHLGLQRYGSLFPQPRPESITITCPSF
ncbi:hypothetical protein DFH29DRAFT_412252 [Suillus ampliporus]|nr:hypothetical protein DFH29DRAFT_412252 [Suillus ampliporus]